MNRRVAHEAVEQLSVERPTPHRVTLGGEDTFVEAHTRRSFRSPTADEEFHEATTVDEQYRQRRHETEATIAETVVRVGLAADPPRRERTRRICLPDGTDCERNDTEGVPTAPLSTERLAAVLGEALGGTVDGQPYPSAGNMYPVESYVLTGRDLPESGAFAYTPDEHALVPVGGTETRQPLSHEQTTTFVCLTGVFPRTNVRYGPRGYRYVLQEAGSVTQCLQTAAREVGLDVEPLYEFDDRETEEALGIEGVGESVVQSVAVIGR